MRRGTDLGSDWQRDERSSDKAHSIMFGQNAQTVYDAVDGKADHKDDTE